MDKLEKLINLMMNDSASDGEILNARKALKRKLESTNNSLGIKNLDESYLKRERIELYDRIENLMNENINLRNDIDVMYTKLKDKDDENRIDSILGVLFGVLLSILCFILVSAFIY